MVSCFQHVTCEVLLGNSHDKRHPPLLVVITEHYLGMGSEDDCQW